MPAVATVLVLLCLVTLLSVLTRRWTIPYPTIMVLTGLAIALIPGLPDVQLTPEVVFLIFLPPLLYAAAWQTHWTEFKKNARPISMLALELVLVTTVVGALVAKQLIPDLPWAAAFALGAIISPPDARDVGASESRQAGRIYPLPLDYCATLTLLSNRSFRE